MRTHYANMLQKKGGALLFSLFRPLFYYSEKSAETHSISYIEHRSYESTEPRQKSNRKATILISQTTLPYNISPWSSHSLYLSTLHISTPHSLLKVRSYISTNSLPTHFHPKRSTRTISDFQRGRMILIIGWILISKSHDLYIRMYFVLQNRPFHRHCRCQWSNYMVHHPLPALVCRVLDLHLRVHSQLVRHVSVNPDHEARLS